MRLSPRTRMGCRRPRLRRRRRGVYIAELVITMPVFMIFLWAVIEFGIFFSNLQEVQLASRVGAEAASEYGALPTADGDPVPDPILDAIEYQLLSSDITWCRVRVEHNVGGTQYAAVSGSCACEPTTKLAPPLPPDEYVRVSVCVAMSELMPNLLALFGFDVSDPSRVVSCTTVMRSEP